jgi:hypothetical protein
VEIKLVIDVLGMGVCKNFSSRARSTNKKLIKNQNTYIKALKAGGEAFI